MPTLAEIARLLDCAPPPGSETQPVVGIGSIADAQPDEITYVASDKYSAALESTRAAAAIAPRRLKIPPAWESRILRVDDADLALGKVLRLFAPPVPRPAVGVDPLARISSSAELGPDVAIGPFSSIGQRSRLGRGCVIHANVFIGDDVSLGENGEIFPGVVIRERITIGNRVVIHAGSVLGTDGFGYRWDGRQHQKIPQIGTVIIEDDVEIGSCVCIDRAKFSATRIGQGTKIDNLVQIGHNVEIGPHCIIVGQVGLAGSCRLGTGVVLGGQTAVRDHIKMGDGAMAAACSAVAEDVDPKAIVSGVPALPHRQSLREQAALRRLPDLVTQMRKLEEELATIRKQIARPE
ncbi:MAG TPA: UDP-3-O-(3-hydroxymyristoyl)glucosamine N-acyltransferase [Tepidisphaeraceae bacterium]|jgi:UDP-3-O-[3-hydroxymyristoyl] glucosamine N-acyltransferase